MLALLLFSEAHAQAWVSAPGTATVSLGYQLTHVKNHLFSQDVTAFGGDGNALDLGKIDAQTGQLSVDYAVARNLGVSASVAYVGAAYHGISPESMMDNGKFHGTFQDVGLTTRYMIPWQGFAITPNVGVMFPTHAYDHHGHVAAGRGNTSFDAGLELGRTFSPWVPNAFAQASYTRDFTRDIQQWGLDTNLWMASLGWYVLPQLSASSYFSYYSVEDGIDWYWDDFSAPGVEHNHDRAAKTLARRVGGTLSYQFTSSKGLFLDIGGIVSGANTHDGISYTLGTNWSFLGPAFHRD